MHASNAITAQKKVQYVLQLTEDIDAFLEDQAEQSGTTKSDVFRKAIALIKVTSLAKEKGQQLALIDPKSEKVVTHIVGL